jgi:hypothetical protein
MINSLIVATANAPPGHHAGAARHLRRLPLPAGRQGKRLLLDHHQPHGPAGGVPAAALPALTQAFAIGEWKLYDTRIGLILLYCVFNLPFAIWTCAASSKASRRSSTKRPMSTAHDLAGADRVILPLARPGLAVTAILTWVFAWNEYLSPRR